MLTLGGNVAAIPAKAESTAGTSAPNETRHVPTTTISNDAKHAKRQHGHEHEAEYPRPRCHGQQPKQVSFLFLILLISSSPNRDIQPSNDATAGQAEPDAARPFRHGWSKQAHFTVIWGERSLAFQATAHRWRTFQP